jgi:hypothetical protein
MGHDVPTDEINKTDFAKSHQTRHEELTMFTKTKIALAAALVATTSSMAFAAQKTAPVQLRSDRSAVEIQQNANGYADPFEVDRADRASSPYAGGN